MEGRSPFVKYWLPALLWMGVIFIGSTSLFSSHQTSRFFRPFLLWLAPGLPDVAIERIEFGVRKCGHLFEYAVLAVLLCRAIRQPQLKDRSEREGPPVFWAFFGAVLYAVSDELHQSLVATRFGTTWDVAIDALGAALGLCALWLKRTRRDRS